MTRPILIKITHLYGYKVESARPRLLAQRRCRRCRRLWLSFWLLIDMAKNFICSCLGEKKMLLLTPLAKVGASERALRVKRAGKQTREQYVMNALLLLLLLLCYCKALQSRRLVGVAGKQERAATREREIDESEREFQQRLKGGCTTSDSCLPFGGCDWVRVCCWNNHGERRWRRRRRERNARKWVYADRDDAADVVLSRLRLLPGNDVWLPLLRRRRRHS